MYALIQKSAKKSCALDPMPTPLVIKCLDVLLPLSFIRSVLRRMEGSSSQSSPKENWIKLGVLQPSSGQQSAVHIEIDRTCCFRSNAQPYERQLKLLVYFRKMGARTRIGPTQRCGLFSTPTHLQTGCITPLYLEYKN